MPVFRHATSKNQRQAIADGDQQALLNGLICQALLWASYSHPHTLSTLQASSCSDAVANQDPVHGALLAAAQDLIAMLALSHEGRQALLDFGHKPVL